MSIGETVEGACGATLRLNEWLFTMDNADLTKLIAAQIALRFLSGLLFSAQSSTGVDRAHQHWEIFGAHQ